MKRFRYFALVSAALALTAVALPAETGSRANRQTRVVSRQAPGVTAQSGHIVPSSVTATGYSEQLNIVTRVQGLAFYRTTVDITNNTSTDGVTALFQYCYNFNGIFEGCTDGITIVLQPFDAFHTDDIVDYLGQQGKLPADAQASSYGTFIVTFNNLPSGNGWEGTVLGRTYSALDAAHPLDGVLAFAYQGSLFFESATGTLVGLVRDTRLAPTEAGALRTNLGVTNTALFNNVDPNATVDFQLTFYDTATGQLVLRSDNGQPAILIPPHPLAAGEVYQFNDVFTAAHIDTNVTSCIVFIDITSPQGTLPDTIEGYIVTLDSGTNDGAYFEMRCGAGCGGGTF